MNRKPPGYHEDLALFREALSYTQSAMGFSARLVEKDYFGSLILGDLKAVTSPPWVFKGGTCLSKVHSDFYRLSEDLDFAYSVPLDALRSQRSKIIAPVKEHLATLAQRLACFQLATPLRGHNNSTQYLAELRYRSVVTGQDEAVKVEFSIREPILDPVEFLPARALLVDPFRQSAAIVPVSVPVLSLRETYAEKFRAALTLREPAIRDFFDLDHAVRSGRLNTGDDRLLELVRQKLAVRGNASIDVSDAKREVLKRQVQAQLRPVLREADFVEFDVDRAFETVAMIARALA